MRRWLTVPLFSVVVFFGIGGFGLWRWLAHDWRLFLPGQTSHAHYQIEMACTACHTPYAGVKQDACQNCHPGQLSAATNAHPVDKLAAPAGGGETFDPTRCVSCHREHVPHLTRNVAVTQPPDFCVHCHADIGKQRPSHRTFAFSTCASSGCHNYHDNTSLRADDLAARRADPAVLARPILAARDRTHQVRHVAGTPTLYQQWENSTHARATVTCPKCHEARRGATSPPLGATSPPLWEKRPGPTACSGCHPAEVKGFLAGRHGMRLLHGLPPMTPAMARLPMKPDAGHDELTCSSCHSAHTFDTRSAPVEACLACHDDEHSRAYPKSPHHALWQAEVTGQKPVGSGVSCATCHLPRAAHLDARRRVLTGHNENDTMRPTTKMLGRVCLHCHGLPFAIDALADPNLARTNYTGRPSRHVQSVDMVRASEPKSATPASP